MNRKKSIVHIVYKDKFSVGYVNFMKLKMSEYEHYFLIPEYECSTYNESDLVDLKNIYYYHMILGNHIPLQFLHLFLSLQQGSLFIFSFYLESFIQ